MALIIKDRVKEITTTTGTGAVSLGGASATFDAFQSVMSNGDTTFYAIVHTASGTDEWEVGVGTFNTGNTLTRTTVYAGSNGASAVNFSSGNKDIFMTYPASKAAVAGEDVTFADITATDITATGTVTLSGDPTSALQAATKEYVDTIAAAGIHYHTPVRVESPSALTATYDNGSSGVGATLTNSGTQAALVIDGVTLSTSDRVLVYNQTNAAHNGIYTVTNTGSASTNWVLTRATDADSYGASDPDALGEGDAYFVKEGDTGAGELYVMNTSGVITFGTTNITFTVIAETAVYSAGTGLTLTGTTFSTNQDISTSASPTFNNITVTGTVDGRDVATDGSKLDGIEAGATADQTAAEIKTAYESNSDTNAFTDAEQTKLSGIETGATGDQTASEILTAIKTVDGAGSGLDADLLDGLQASSYLNTSTTFSGDVSGTYNNIVVANDSHTHDGRYYTETEADSRFWNASGDETITGKHKITHANTGTEPYIALTIENTGTSAGIALDANSGSGRKYEIQSSTGGDFFVYDRDATAYRFYISNSGALYNGQATNRIFADNYHPNADKWTTARTLSLSGDASGSVSWDGSANATLSVSVGDADTVDNLHASSFLRSDASDTFTSGTLTFGGGTTVDLSTNDVYLNARVIHNASGGVDDGLFLGYANANSGITRLYGSGSTSPAVTVYSNYATATSSFRAPIFYDSNNTSYYTDPASTSSTNLIRSNQIYDNGGSRGLVLGNFAISNTDQWPLVTWAYGTGYDEGLIHGSSSRGVFGRAHFGIHFDDDRSFAFHTSSWDTEMEICGDGRIYQKGPVTIGTGTNHSSAPALYVYQGNRSAEPYTGIYVKNPDTTGAAYTGVAIDAVAQSHLRFLTNGSLKWQFRTGTTTSGALKAYSWDGAADVLTLTSGGSLTATGDMRSTVFYDSNDTNYYVNPNSSSDAAVRVRGGALFGPNTTWGDYLMVGGNGRQNYTNNTTTASVVTTDGNLHLDAASGHNTYINYYDGNNVYFGSGSNTIVGSISNAGVASFASLTDYNNTAYYVDPASTSLLNALEFGDTAGPTLSQERDQNLKLQGGSGGDVGITGYGGDGGWDFQLYGSGGMQGFLRSNWGSWSAYADTSGNWTGTASVRAPIFYDSANTSYFLDPASSATSLSALGSVLVGENAGYSFTRESEEWGGMSAGLVRKAYDTSNTTHATSKFTLGDYIRQATTSTLMNFSVVSTVDGTTASSDTYYQEFVGYYWAPTSGTYGFSVDGDDSVDVLVDGKLVGYWYGGHGVSNSYTGGSTGSNGGTVQTYGTIYLVRGFHRIKVRHQENSGGDEVTLWHQEPSGSWEIVTSDHLYHNGSDLIHATGSGTSLMSSTLTAPTLRVGDGNDGRFFSDTNGRTAFADGDFYIQTSVGNFYNYATNQYLGNTSGDNIYVRGNTISGNSWSITGAGVGTFGTDARAPIFYDSNNTGYYVDPASTSNLNALNVGGNAVLTTASTVGNADTVDSLHASSFIRSDTFDNVNANTNWPDNRIISVGTSQDCEIYFDGTDARIEWNAIAAGSIMIGETNFSTFDPVIEAYMDLNNPYAILYRGGAEKLRTVSTGIDVTGDVNSTSDIRYKKNIETIDDALSKVQALRGVTFDWDNDAFSANRNGKKPDFTQRATGVIAQDVEKVLPEAVREKEDGFKNVAYGNMVGLLIEAIKEQQKQIDDLKAQIAKVRT